MEEPIFQSVHHALHVAFLMEILPVSQKSQMQQMIELAEIEAGIVRERSCGSINFSGLSPQEVRGQCSMIRAVVQDHLPQPEQHAIHARFGYQLCKAKGVRGIRDYAKPQMSIEGDEATLALAWSIYCTKNQRKDFSLQKMAEEYGFAKTTAHRDVQKLRQVGQALLDRAEERLRCIFSKSGVV